MVSSMAPDLTRRACTQHHILHTNLALPTRVQSLHSWCEFTLQYNLAHIHLTQLVVPTGHCRHDVGQITGLTVTARTHFKHSCWRARWDGGGWGELVVFLMMPFWVAKACDLEPGQSGLPP
jgi:hypothetical protein